jgi:hypothetical protein
MAFVRFTDFCSGGEENTPDASVFDILEERGNTEVDIVYKAVRYYVRVSHIGEQSPLGCVQRLTPLINVCLVLKQCVTEDPWAFIREYDSQIEAASIQISKFLDSFNAVTTAQLSLLCGKDFGPIEALLQDTSDLLATLDEGAKATMQLLSCERITPIYLNTVYDGTCTYSVRGLTWTWSAFLVVAFAGMLMLTFRSVLWNVESNSKALTEEYSMGEPAERYYEENGAAVQQPEYSDYGYSYDDDDNPFEQPKPVPTAPPTEELYSRSSDEIYSPSEPVRPLY